MNALAEYVSRQQLREQTGWSLNFIDRNFPRTKIGGKVFIPVDAVSTRLGGGYGAPAPKPLRTFPDCWELARRVQRLWNVQERRAPCDRKMHLLFSSIAAFLFENEAGDVLSDEFVIWLLNHLPQAGGSVGEAMRKDIRDEAVLRGISNS